jgi:molybdopterin molybdotransferase
MKLTLITVDEAEARLAGFQDVFPVEDVPLAQAGGRILRTAIRADREYPALDRSRMDGIAIAFAAWEMGVRDYPVGGMARAGDPRGRLDDAAGCVEIMTGAPCPEGADTVIPYEALMTREFGNAREGQARVASVQDDATVAQGQFLHRQGSDCAQGEILVEAGVSLNAPRIAVAASMGYARLEVTRRPRIAIVATGDELVSVDEVPLPHQIRGSNGHALRALFEPMGIVSLHSVGDARGALAERLRESLAACDVLLVTGGVSAGKFDEVPGVLKELGVEEVFHKVAQKPGKPLWFGRGPEGQLVFGLPGNPVSALVCARRYVVPLLHTKSGKTAGSTPKSAKRVGYSGALPAPSNLTQFVPVRLVESVAIPCVVNGSGDFSGLGRSDGFVEIPAQKSSLPAGELLSFFGWET